MLFLILVKKKLRWHRNILDCLTGEVVGVDGFEPPTLCL